MKYKYKVGQRVRYTYWKCEPIVCDKCGHETYLGAEEEEIQALGVITERDKDYCMSAFEPLYTFREELQDDGSILKIPELKPLAGVKKENFYTIEEHTVCEDNIKEVNDGNSSRL